MKMINIELSSLDIFRQRINNILFGCQLKNSMQRVPQKRL